MFSPKELSAYLSDLPKDFVLKLGEKTFKINKELGASLSDLISSYISTNPSSNTFSIDREDKNGTFVLVASFLNGKIIEITPDNDYFLDGFADYLGIASLKKLTSNSIRSPLSETNVLQRLLNNLVSDDTALKFIEQNTEKVIKKKMVFDLKPFYLEKIIHSENATFSNVSSRYTFAFNCCLKYIDSAPIFITDSDLNKIPDEVFLQITSNDTYSRLDGQIQTFAIALKTLKDLDSIEKEINKANDDITTMTNEVTRIRDEEERILNEKGKTSIKFSEVRTRRIELSDKIQKAATAINLKAPDLSQFVVSKHVLIQINEKISFLDSKADELNKVLNKIQGRKIVFDELRVNGLKMAQKFEAALKPLHELFQMLIPNYDDISQLIEDLRKVSRELQIMADTLVREQIEAE